MIVYWLFAKTYAARILDFFVKYPWQMACLLLAIAAWWQWDSAKDWRAIAGDEKSAHAQSVKNWQSAYAQAVQKNLREVAAIESKQAQIIEKEVIKYVYVKQDYRAVVAARSSRLPVQADAGSSCPIGYGLPVVSKMPAGPLHPDTAAIVSRTDLDIVADNQAKLEGLVWAWRALEK